jgi:hypothetical protein
MLVRGVRVVTHVPMVLFVSALVAAVAAVAAGSALPPAGVWPLPKSSTCGPGMGGSLSAGFQLSASGPGATTDVVMAALERYKPILLSPTHAATTNGAISKVNVAVASAEDSLSEETDYSYTIQADATSITATAASPFGVAYALESLSQLMEQGQLKCSALTVDDSVSYGAPLTPHALVYARSAAQLCTLSLNLPFAAMVDRTAA